MHITKIDLKRSSASIDSVPIAVDEKGVLAGSIAKLCSPRIETDEGQTQYCLLRKVSVCEKSANDVIEVGEGRVCTVTFFI